jgi:hypothetical protein
MKRLILLVPIICFLFYSCAVQKRKYQKGYHVVWHKAQNHTDRQKKVVSKNKTSQIEDPQKTVQSTKQISEPAPDLVSSADPHLSFAELKRQNHLNKKDEPCDEIIFRDGTESKAKVIEITPTEIKYKKCDNLEGPTYIAKKAEVFMIKYANGSREVFKETVADETKTQKKNKNVDKSKLRFQPFAILSLVFGILSFILYFTIIFGPLAIVFGNIALRKIEAQPEIYKGESMATAGKTLGIVFLSIIGLIVLIAIIALIILASI